MDKVIDLESYRKSKEKKKEDEELRTTGIKQEMRNSLDNSVVKRRYGIPPPPPPPTLEQRMDNIRASVQRINALMAELKEKNDGNK